MGFGGYWLHNCEGAGSGGGRAGHRGDRNQGTGADRRRGVGGCIAIRLWGSPSVVLGLGNAKKVQFFS